MNFFAQLAGLGQGMDIALRIKGKNGKLTIMVEPQLGNNSRLKPLVLTGTPEELDEGFFAQFDGLISAAKGLESNLPDVKQDAQDLAKSKTEKKEQPAKSAASKPVKEKPKGKEKKSSKKSAAAKPQSKKTAESAAPMDMFNSPAEEQSRQSAAPAAAESGVRTCRVCGCTEEDCRQCIEKTGSPCHWVGADLCSACAPELQVSASASDTDGSQEDSETE